MHILSLLRELREGLLWMLQVGTGAIVIIEVSTLLVNLGKLLRQDPRGNRRTVRRTSPAVQIGAMRTVV